MLLSLEFHGLAWTAQFIVHVGFLIDLKRWWASQYWALLNILVPAFAFEAYYVAVVLDFSPFLCIAVLVLFVDFPQKSGFVGGYGSVVLGCCAVPRYVDYERSP